METVNWKVEGMTCSNCALTISKYLERSGMGNVKVNLIGGDVSFDINGSASANDVQRGIEDLGYSVRTVEKAAERRRKFLSTHFQRFVFCAIFTVPLMLHMFDQWVHIPVLMDPWVQMGLSLPVYIVGMRYFGKSALKSIRNGMPNMNVLIAIGASAAFVYSLIGALMELGGDYLFFETAAAIITLVFLGNYLEDASIRSTQRALNKLAKTQTVMANMIVFDEEHREVIMPLENSQLRQGDLILIKSGEQVPADCKILWGEASVSEAIITGESIPLEKKAKDRLIGGSIINDGTVKAQVTADARNSVLSNIINLVKRAQSERPPVQQMADKISAVFVPAVLVIAAVTFVINYFVIDDVTSALMRSIAVLVIACPCAMGLATPAAIAVGLGRAARRGILFRNAKSLELFKDIRQVVFDKTGTLTTGDFKIDQYNIEDSISESEFKKVVFSLEKFSNHPIARAISSTWQQQDVIRWKKIDEIKGVGMKGETQDGTVFQAVSFKFAAAYTRDDRHNVYVLKNDSLIGWIDVVDEIRPESIKVVQYLRNKGVKTYLLSGDRESKCQQLAGLLGIDEVIAEKTPEEKLQVIENLTIQAPTAMVGDGINDAPALAKATIGISMGEASQIAMQTADVVLISKGIQYLPSALGLGKHTYITIKQNLFWAFIYNIVAIPVAAFGFLTPTFGALVMGLSDVVLAINSGRLYTKKVV